MTNIVSRKFKKKTKNVTLDEVGMLNSLERIARRNAVVRTQTRSVARYTLFFFSLKTIAKSRSCVMMQINNSLRDFAKMRNTNRLKLTLRTHTCVYHSYTHTHSHIHILSYFLRTHIYAHVHARALLDIHNIFL